MRKYKTAIFIARAQPFHIAHLEIIKLALEEADNLIIAVGSCNKPITIKNPWTAKERIQMIKDSLACDASSGWQDFNIETDTRRIQYIEIRDYMYNDMRWSAEVFAKATQIGATDDRDTALYGCWKSKDSYFLNMFPQWELREVDYLFNLNATDIRNFMFETKSVGRFESLMPKYITQQMLEFLETERFHNLLKDYDYYKKYKEKLSGYAFPPTFNTTDCVVIKSGHILLIERGRHPSLGHLALPGGFVEQDERLEDGAIRELKEETNIKLDTKVLRNNIKEVRVFDHPSRDFRGRIITHAHLIDLGQTGPLPLVTAGDDAGKAFWVPLADVLASEKSFFADHFDVIISLTSRF